MPALDTKQAMYDHVAAMLRARPLLSAIKPRNWITTDEKGFVEAMASRTAPADFPWLALVSTGGGLVKPILTFDPSVDREIPCTETFDVRLVFDVRDNDHTMPYEAQVKAGLYSQGDNLGLDWVAWFTARQTRKLERLPDANSPPRVTSTTAVTAECRPLLSEIISVQ